MNKKYCVQNTHLTSFFVFFLLSFQLWSKAIRIRVDGNQIKDLALSFYQGLVKVITFTQKT